MIDILEEYLSLVGYTFLRLDSTVDLVQRSILIEQFNQDKSIFLMICSTRISGTYLNMTGVDTLIFYDFDWNPTMNSQILDRCQQINYSRDLHVYR